MTFRKAGLDLSGVSHTIATTTLRSAVRICSARSDDVTKVCVILASHPPKPSPPSLLSSLPFSSSLLIPGSLFVSQFPCVFVPNLLPRLLLPVLSLSLSALCPSASLFLPLNSPLAWFWLLPPLPPLLTSTSPFPLIPPLFLLSVVLPRSVWLSSVIKHRRSDTDRM